MSAWGGFAAALAARDTAQALQYFNTQGQVKYGRVLGALRTDLPRIVATLTPLHAGTISDAVGEYLVGRTINGVAQVFFIYFLRDADGVWRLDSL
jgi:hypothetical protein